MMLVLGLQVKGNGSFLMYAGQEPQHVTIGDAEAEFSYDAATRGLRVQLAQGEKLTREVTVQF